MYISPSFSLLLFFFFPPSFLPPPLSFLPPYPSFSPPSFPSPLPLPPPPSPALSLPSFISCQDNHTASDQHSQCRDGATAISWTVSAHVLCLCSARCGHRTLQCTGEHCIVSHSPASFPSSSLPTQYLPVSLLTFLCHIPSLPLSLR